MAMDGDYTIEQLAEICEEQKRQSDAENRDAAELDERIEKMIEERERANNARNFGNYPPNNFPPNDYNPYRPNGDGNGENKN